MESAEYKDIHDHLDAIQLMKQETAEAEKSHSTSSSKKQQAALNDEPAASPESSLPIASHLGASPETTPSMVSTPAVSLEQRVHDLRQQVERLVKTPGAPLKSAPFHTASTLKSLPGGTDVLIVVSTPYWFGVETHDGQHGWILRDELELLP